MNLQQCAILDEGEVLSNIHDDVSASITEESDTVLEEFDKDGTVDYLLL